MSLCHLRDRNAIQWCSTVCMARRPCVNQSLTISAVAIYTQWPGCPAALLWLDRLQRTLCQCRCANIHYHIRLSVATENFPFGQSKLLTGTFWLLSLLEWPNISSPYIHTYIHTYKGSVTCAILCLGWVFGVFQFSTAKSREPILAQNIFNWRASGHECAFEVVKTILTFSIVFVTKNVIWADFVESFFPVVKCERCRDFWRTLLWRNRRRYRLFSEHLILSWCYSPCRMSTRGNGSVTDPVSV